MGATGDVSGSSASSMSSASSTSFPVGNLSRMFYADHGVLGSFTTATGRHSESISGYVDERREKRRGIRREKR